MSKTPSNGRSRAAKAPPLVEAEVQDEVQVAEDPPLQAQVGMLEAMRIAPASGR